MNSLFSTPDDKYLGACDLYDVGNELILTISGATEETVIGDGGLKSIKKIMSFSDHKKRLILNQTNKRCIAMLFKTENVDKLVGKKIKLVVRQVSGRNGKVDAIRVSPELPPQTQKMEPEKPPEAKTTAAPALCADCAKEIRQFGRMTAAQLTLYTKDKYGRALCADCAKKAAEGTEEKEAPEEGENNAAKD